MARPHRGKPVVTGSGRRFVATFWCTDGHIHVTIGATSVEDALRCLCVQMRRCCRCTPVTNEIKLKVNLDYNTRIPPYTPLQRPYLEPVCKLVEADPPKRSRWKRFWNGVGECLAEFLRH